MNNRIVSRTVLLLTLVLSLPAFAQDGPADSSQPAEKTKSKREIGKAGKFYASWGFNRGYHAEADTTFHTVDGHFTIHNAHGDDRPSQDFSSYVFSTRAQYNIRFGRFLTDRWAIEGGTDHMKWVFDNSRNYVITGDYNRQVWIGGQLVDFDTAKQNQDASFVKFDHTNGYNYLHVSALYFVPIVASSNKHWFLVGAVGGGVGFYVTKTRVEIMDQATPEPRIRDNEFTIAGYGGHVEAKLRGGYKNFYLEAASRHGLGEITNAPFLGNEGRISHSQLYSRQLMISVGAEFRFSKNKNKEK